MFRHIFIDKKDILYIAIVVNNWSDRSNIDIIIHYVTYFVSSLSLKYDIELTLITTYPKLHTRTITINQCASSVLLYYQLNKIVRNKSGKLLSTNNIADDDESTIYLILKTPFTSSEKGGEFVSYDIILIYDENATLLEKTFRNVKPTTSTSVNQRIIYCSNHFFLDNDPMQIINLHVSQKDSSMYCNEHIYELFSYYMGCCNTNKRVHAESNCNMLEKYITLDNSIYLAQDINPFSDSSAIESLIVNTLSANTLSINTLSINTDNKDYIDICKSVRFKYFPIEDISQASHDTLINYLECLISDARYLSLLSKFTARYVQIWRAIRSELIIIDNVFSANDDSSKLPIILASNLIYHYITKILYCHHKWFFKTTTDKEGDMIIHDDKNVKKSLESLKYYSAQRPISNRRYYQKMHTDDNIITVCNNIDTLVKEHDEDALYDLETMYISYLKKSVQSDSNIYKTVLTMSDWIDELKEGNCIGVCVDIMRGATTWKGIYNIRVTNPPLMAGSSTEMFETIRLKSCNDETKIDLNANIMIGGNDDVLGSKTNCIIPLYIHKMHWRIASQYMNIICNLIMYDTMTINNESSWKIIYVVLIDFATHLFLKDKRNKSVKYFFSLWLTANVLSRKNKYDSGLNYFLTKMRLNGKTNNIDPIMMAGQIISVGFNNIDQKNIDMISQLMLEKYVDYKNVNDLATLRITYVVELNRIFAFDTLGQFFKSRAKNSSDNLSKSLKKTFGIPTNDIVSNIFEIIDSVDVDKNINAILDTINQ